MDEIVPIIRTIDDHIDDWDAASDFVMKSLLTHPPIQHR
jgi:hypothetical protein